MRKTSLSEMIRKRSNITALLLCAAGIALNLFLSFGAAALELPLYLDTVGTVAVALMGGYLPGVVVGFATNLIKALSDPSALYYGVLNVLIGFSAAFMAQRQWHRRISGMIGMVLVFTLIGGGIGSLIPWFMEGLAFDSESLSGMIHENLHVGLGISHVLSALLTDLPDKTITVILSVLAVRFIPAGFHHYFDLNMWMQNPDKEAQNFRIKKANVRTVSMRTKILFVLVFSLTVVAIICSLLSVRVFQKMTVKEHTQLAMGTAELAASVINGDHVKDYLESGGKSEEYKDTARRIDNVFRSSPEISYLYVYKMEPEGFRVIFDVETEDVPAGELGSLIPYDSTFEPYIPQLLAGEAVDPIITNDEYGYLLTAACPVYDSDGLCACYAIADVDMEKLVADSRSFLTEMISVFLGFFILICTFIVWMADYHLIVPINSIVSKMDELARGSDTQEKMDEDVKMFRKLGIHTGDELENLYLAASSMTKTSAEQMRSIRRLSDSTAKMQDGLIITMADLVESRDSDTGAHVQKTAAYVKIIVEGLKKKGYYLQKITPKFMSDVVRSAPLHDIGKINIPDEVLNKPGKLTDEEYEIMKTHTVAGKRIMENAISTVEGDNYLKEARNMAAYHHERWDGKGYPEGIHGEVIPLSARIMAVADVFDALTSPRVYKSAFPLEKSLAILEEGKGTQFDPKCVEVFLDALPEVKVILHKYNQNV
ncbi:MAG: HD domain-containing protein [Lachnospiraceae bacterium]|nr:HD domain-containing protein [Lachnospiraceae bacterium]